MFDLHTRRMSAIGGGSYRLMLFELPGFIQRSFMDQTLLAMTIDRDEAIYDFRVSQRIRWRSWFPRHER